MGGTMPIAYGDTILVGAGNGLMAFRPSQRDGTWVTETLWQTSDVTFYLSNPVVVGDTIFGLSQRDRGQYFAIDAKTGKVLWLGPPRQATNTAVVKADGLLFLLNDNAELIVARANPDAFEPTDALHRRRQRHVGAADALRQAYLRQGCEFADAVDC